MSNIFIGMILVFLNFNLNLGNSIIGLIPNFIGYYFMYKGLKEIEEDHNNFGKVLPIVQGMIVYTAITWVFDLLGISVSLGIFTYVLAIASLALSLYISYHIVTGIVEVEQIRNIDINGQPLYGAWKAMAIACVASFFLVFIPVLAFIAVIAAVVASIYYLVQFSRTKNMYTIG